MNPVLPDMEHLEALRRMVDPERFSTGSSELDLHSRDESGHRPRRPDAVIWPVDRTEVSEILRYASARKVPVTCWGSGSSLEGNPIPVQGGIVLDFSRMNRILDIRDADFQADVEPGVIYQDLNRELRHKGLFFPPDPGARATIGGMIANNASGTRTVRYGSTKDHVIRMAVVLAGGECIELGTRASKSSSGYDLLHLFVGSEGTLGAVVEATVRLSGIPAEVSAAIANFPSLEAASRTVFEIIRSGLNPDSLELMAPECVDLVNREKGLGLHVSPTIFMEFSGPTTGYLKDVLEMVEDICRDNGCRDFRPGIGRSEAQRVLKARHELGEMIIRDNPGCRVISLDIAVPISAFPAIMGEVEGRLKKTGLRGYTFSHAGDGNVHLALAGRKGHKEEWERIDRLNGELVRIAIDLGGTATGEHGVGIGKREFMEYEHGPALGLMKRIKGLLDPSGILNPGKIFPDGM